MFIAKQGELIVQVSQDRNDLLKKIEHIPVDIIEETNDIYTLYKGQFLNQEEIKVKEKERIMGLSMTPLDFLKAIEKYAGVSYAQIKELCDSNPEVDRELRFCQNIYRNNEMLIGLASQFNVTEEQLDMIFDTVDKMKNGEIE